MIICAILSRVNICLEYTNNPDIPKANVSKEIHGTLMMIVTAIVLDLIIVETSIKIAFSLFTTKPQHTALYRSIYASECATRMTPAVNYLYYFSCCSYFSFNPSQRSFLTCQQRTIKQCKRMWRKNKFNFDEFSVIRVLYRQYNLSL